MNKENAIKLWINFYLNNFILQVYYQLKPHKEVPTTLENY